MSEVLGVNKSVLGQKWVIKKFDPKKVEELVKNGIANENMAKMLVSRGVDLSNIGFYMQPALRDMPDPFLILTDADKAAKRIADAIVNKEKIAIFGDYDVDGATSTSLMYKFLKHVCDEDVIAKIPEREDGYGPTPAAMEDFVQQGVKLIITVDCGTSAFEAFEAVPNTDIVVIDHHEQDGSLPNVVALVNPKRQDEKVNELTLKFRPRDMAAVGVVFMVLIGLNRELRQRGWYSNNHSEPDLRMWLDMVALGTICDVMKLQGLNRLFVKYGLYCLSKGYNKGLAYLCNNSKIKGDITEHHLGYAIGPRLNAGGRIGHASLGMKLLCAQNEEEAQVIALQLDELNVQRRQLCEEIFRQAITLVESGPDEPIIFVHGREWHPGVIGIIAGKLKERYKRPALVMCGVGDDCHGSGRSVPEFDLGACILAAKEKGILTNGGGHTLAAGFSVPEERKNEFKKFLIESMHDRAVSIVENPEYEIDAVFNLREVNWSLLQYIKKMEPFGEGNPEPRIAVADVIICNAKIVGSGHIACYIKGAAGQTGISAIAFNVADTELGVMMMRSKGELFHIVGYVQADTYNGQTSIQFIIEDIALAN
ncbi:MAG: single-stranded-DNA-specific exonuclease RecJ [Alphaproteobacteria bacterium]|nr:single-stranded-DNA-specific exonuclease RecJ [Alphaproteobacteria bacterium]